MKRSEQKQRQESGDTLDVKVKVVDGTQRNVCGGRKTIVLSSLPSTTTCAEVTELLMTNFFVEEDGARRMGSIRLISKGHVLNPSSSLSSLTKTQSTMSIMAVISDSNSQRLAPKLDSDVPQPRSAADPESSSVLQSTEDSSSAFWTVVQCTELKSKVWPPTRMLMGMRACWRLRRLLPLDADVSLSISQGRQDRLPAAAILHSLLACRTARGVWVDV
eukprot:CAMPEP_0181324294 /NCGR_PEP_ID=MMETSP1101-20121128/20278_1 /TAXON_ID=46948 /ORGANISM="Rhodomonas abbreviata, Strain Caron Lab Isolate" /LENGTH=217 /DNA_ID=CAMNT_0023432451 /DNA_START=189 /DNA_END=838 /DNA_ORIENTATION=+